MTEANFETEVLERSKEQPVVVQFWATWCGPCRMLAPVLERETESRADRLAYAKVDVDASPMLANEYDVRGVPAVKAFRNGAVVSEFAGARPPQAVAEFLDALTQPSQADRLAEELRSSGEWPEVLAALERGDHEAALELLLSQAANGNPEGREQARRLMVALFDQLGVQHPLSLQYRRRLASAIF